MALSLFLKRFQFAAGICAFFILSACSGGSTGSGGTAPPVVTPPDLSPSVAQSVQTALVDAAGGMSLANSPDAGQTSTASTPCMSASPQPPLDSNSNGIPDNETYTLANCTQQLAGGQSATLNGSYTIVDGSQPGGPLTWTRTVPSMSVSIAGPAFNGTDARSGQAVHTLVSPTQETIVRTFTNNWNAGAANAWTATNTENVTFTSNGASIVPLTAPPSGTIAVTGSHQVTQGSTSTTYAITTPGLGLSYDSTCQFLPRITAGSIVLTPPSGPVVTLTYTACGSLPTITKM